MDINGYSHGIKNITITPEILKLRGIE